MSRPECAISPGKSCGFTIFAYFSGRMECRQLSVAASDNAVPFAGMLNAHGEGASSPMQAFFTRRHPDIDAPAAHVGHFKAAHAFDFDIATQPLARGRAGAPVGSRAGGGAAVAVVGAHRCAHLHGEGRPGDGEQQQDGNEPEYYRCTGGSLHTQAHCSSYLPLLTSPGVVPNAHQRFSVSENREIRVEHE